MSVRLSTRMEQICSHWTDLHKILYLSIFDTWQENSIIGLLKGYLGADEYTSLSYLVHFLLECEMFWTKFVEKIKTHNFFFAQ